MTKQPRGSRKQNDLVTGGGRNLESFKAEVQRRADRQMPPVSGISADDARATLARVTSLDRDAWAQAWSATAEKYRDEAQQYERSNAERARKAHWNAWRIEHFARWPTENVPAKVEAKLRALQAFGAYAKLLDPPMETLRIPFEGHEIVAYLRLPRDIRPSPLVFGIAGLDSRKEDVAAQSDAYLKRGLGLFAIDLPGTGESPIAAATVDSNRIFSVALDYLAKRSDIDPKRIVVQGRSWSGYWAAKLAVTERARLAGSVMHGGPIHHYFEPDWLERSLGTDEYLCDYLEAKCAMFGASGLEDMLERAKAFSLLDLGFLDQPSAPMLLVNGARDSQIPIGDLLLMLEHGDAKEAWVNPRGGHMGRSPDWPSSRIANEIVLPWIERRLAGIIATPVVPSRSSK